MQHQEVVESDKSQNTVLESKLRPPLLRHVLDRPRLLRKSESRGTPQLINICAGPGFGKTTLMAQMAREFSGNSVWYQVDGLDRDPAVFLRHLISGFAHAFDFEGTRARARLSEATALLTESESVLAVLIDELREHSQVPLMLCFDDFHLFEAVDYGKRIVEFLVHNLPDQSCLVIATRSNPGLGLGRLRSQGALRELTDDDLQFSLDELSSLTDTWEIKVSPSLIQEVYRSTEGWAAGLVLTENYLRAGSEIPDLFSQRRILQNVYEYLAEEVMNNLPADMQQLLIKVALIDPLDPDICDAALEIDGAGEMLAEAEQRNLFTNRLDDADLYRFHPLFRDFLASRMINQLGKHGMSELRVRFAEAFITAGQERQAIEQFLAAEKYPKAATLIEKIGDEMLHTAEYGTLEKWIGMLNEKDLSPNLQIQRAMILMSAGKFRKALHKLRLTESNINANNLPLHSKSKLALCDCLNELGKNQEAIDILEKLLLQPLSSKDMLSVISQLAVSYWISFDQRGIESCYERAIEIECDDEESKMLCCTNIYEMQSMRQGNFCDAYRSMSRYCDRENISKSKVNAFKNNFASCLLMLGNYEDAMNVATRCEERIKKHREHKHVPTILDTLGCIHIASGNIKKGKKLLEDALQASLEIDQKRADVAADALCHLGTLARRQGFFSEALELHGRSLSEALITEELYEVAMSNINIAADLLRSNCFKDSEEYLNKAEDLSEKYGLQYVKTQILFNRAWAANLMRDNELTHKYLSKALYKANKLQHNHYIIQEGKISMPLFKTALEMGTEVDYVCWILLRIGEESLNTIEPLLDNSDSLVREKIAILLCDIGTGGALTLLRRMRYDTDEQVQKTVKNSLSKLRKSLKKPLEILTVREVEVLECLSQGLTNYQIAKKLFISERTVKTHVAKIFRKLGFTSRINAALYFQQQK